MFSASASPIAIDFGSSSIKLLQVAPGDKPTLSAAAEMTIPDAARTDVEQLFGFLSESLPTVLRAAGFKGKRAICSMPTSQTLVQHMQLPLNDPTKVDDLVKGQLMAQLGIAPESVVVRVIEVGEVYKTGQQRKEVICLAIARDAVMRYVGLLRKCRLEVVGVHSELIAMQKAFEHLHRRKGDEKTTTLYVDLGWNQSKVAIGHGTQLMFARTIQLGGSQFDQLVSKALQCDLATARHHRLTSDQQRFLTSGSPVSAAGAPGASAAYAGAGAAAAASSAASSSGSRQAGAGVAAERRIGQIPRELRFKVAPGKGPDAPSNVDYTELLDALSDELSMSLRYHQSLFPERPIDRIIFLGGEARFTGLCQHLARSLRIPAQLGDPLARFAADAGRLTTPGVNFSQPQPGWAVVCGLCAAPTDL
jgi:type IV pilus assembly protein PilM